MEAEDRALHVATHLLHGKELKDTQLDLVEAAVVLVQDPASSRNVEPVLGAHLPREGGQQLKVGAGDGVLGVVRLDGFQALQLPLRNLHGVLRESHLGEFLRQACCLVLLFHVLVALALALRLFALPLGLGAELLQVLPHLLDLPLQHNLPELQLPRPLDVRADLRGHALGLCLPLQQVQDILEAFSQVQGLQDPLALLQRELHQGCAHHAGQGAGGRGPTPLAPAPCVLATVLAALNKLAHLLLHVVDQRPHCHVLVLAIGRLLQEPHISHPQWCRLREAQNLQPFYALDDKAHLGGAAGLGSRRCGGSTTTLGSTARGGVRDEAAICAPLVEVAGGGVKRPFLDRPHGHSPEAGRPRALEIVADLLEGLLRDLDTCANARIYHLAPQGQHDDALTHCQTVLGPIGRGH
mmetsp:Transcript_93738/g.201217  ORF Transcript_93738/g.201217 Transcript_93738/m.201217 type:complete len:410 (-) Transcript_93738:103-1332(-)